MLPVDAALGAVYSGITMEPRRVTAPLHKEFAMKHVHTPINRTRPVGLRLSLAAIAAVLLRASCTTPPALAVQNEATQRVQTDAFALTLTFLGEAELMSRYGARDNVFIAPQGLLMPERFIPFDVTLTSSERPLVLALNQVEISYGGRTSNPTNQFHFGLYWEQRDQEGGVSGSDVNARQRLIRQTVAPHRIRVAGGSSESSMLLFRGNFPQFGTAVITIAVLDETDRPVDRAVFTFEF